MSAKAELTKLLSELYSKLLELDLLSDPRPHPQLRSIYLTPEVEAVQRAGGQVLLYNYGESDLIDLNKQQIKQLLALSLNIPTPPAAVWTTTLSPLLQCRSDANNKVIFTDGESTHYPTDAQVADLAANLMWLL